MLDTEDGKKDAAEDHEGDYTSLCCGKTRAGSLAVCLMLCHGGDGGYPSGGDGGYPSGGDSGGYKTPGSGGYPSGGCVFEGTYYSIGETIPDKLNSHLSCRCQSENVKACAPGYPSGGNGGYQSGGYKSGGHGGYKSRGYGGYKSGY